MTLTSVGGGLGYKPFSGFIGKFTIYRNRIIKPNEVCFTIIIWAIRKVMRIKLAIALAWEAGDTQW